MTTLTTSLFVYLLTLFVLDVAKAFLVPTASTELCPDILARDKYLHVLQDRCYEFVLFRSHYWSDARRDCSSRGGDLVVISNGDTQDFILGTLRELGNTHHGIWIGLSDRKHELHWEWVNGEPVGPYSHWAHGQGGYNLLHLTQDCAQIRLNDHGLWHDRECHLWPNTAPYICQYDMKQAPSSSTPKTSTTTPPPSTPDKTAGHSVIRTLPASSSPVSSMSTLPTTPMSNRSTSLTAKRSTLSMLLNATRATPSMASSLIQSTSKIPTTPTSGRSTSSTAKRSTLSINMVMNATRASSGVSRSKSTSRISLSSILFTKPSAKSTVTYSRSSIGSMFTEPSSAVSTSVPNRISPSTSNIIDKTDTLSSGKTEAASERVSTTPRSTYAMTSASTPIYVCSDVNCSRTCPNGYSGVFVGLDGCVTCRCN